MAQEVAAILSEAIQTYRLNNTISASTSWTDITPYINYVYIDSVTPIDSVPTFTTYGCNPGLYTLFCLSMHNGGKIRLGNSSFSGTTSNNVIGVEYDPDGSYSGSTSGEGKAIGFNFYYDGKVDSFGVQQGSVCDSNGCFTSDPDPDWFSW